MRQGGSLLSDRPFGGCAEARGSGRLCSAARISFCFPALSPSPAELTRGSGVPVGTAERLRTSVRVGCCCGTSAVHLCWLPRSQMFEIISQSCLVKFSRGKVP